MGPRADWFIRHGSAFSAGAMGLRALPGWSRELSGNLRRPRDAADLSGLDLYRVGDNSVRRGIDGGAAARRYPADARSALARFPLLVHDAYPPALGRSQLPWRRRYNLVEHGARARRRGGGNSADS